MAIAPDNLDPAIRNAMANTAKPTAPTNTPAPTNLDPAIRNAMMGAASRGEYATAPTPTTPQRDPKLEAAAIAGPQLVNGIDNKTYIESRGGINSQGYYNDVPAYSQLTAAELKSVTRPNGTIDSQAQANILIKKQYDYQLSTGMPIDFIIRDLRNTWGGFYNPSVLPKEAQNVTPAPTVSAGAGGTTTTTTTTPVNVPGTPTVPTTPTTPTIPTTPTTPTIPTTPTTPTTTTPTTGTVGLSPERQSIFDVINKRLTDYGLGTLAPVLKQLITDGATEDTITIRLQETPEYKLRFIANEERIKKGLRVLSPSEYIGVEDAYRQVLREYGLKQFDNDAYVSQFIANDVSATELSDRVSMAVQRVQNADPAISRTLRDYYGISQADMVAYVLDPNQQLQKIQRQIAAAEIGTAARIQGIEAGVTVAEQLAAQGISQAQAQKGYATIADILPTAEKLSQIYGATMEGYDLAQAEQEVFNQLASAQRRREQLTQREVAAFSGEAGLGKTSLTQTTGGQF